MGTQGNRDNPYAFDDYLRVRDGFDYYADDPFLQALVHHHCGAEAAGIDEQLRALSRLVSFEHRDLAAAAGTLENRIRCTRLKHIDGHNHRVDEVERCAETERLEREVFALGLFDPSRHTPWSRFAKIFLLAENGEFGVMCPVACTEGMIALMGRYESSLAPEARSLLSWARDGADRVEGLAGRRYAVCAQFLTEIQGGSDVASNLVEAVHDDAAGVWRLYGQKYFCSATQADVALVTAKPRGTDSEDRVAVFAVPAWLPGDRARGARNGCTIDRLKQKLGTAELPTAEITYDGAVAYPVGPLERGLANVVGVTLTISRIHVSLGMAAAGLRAAREATWYAQFRAAFGQPLERFPFVQNQVQDLNHFARRTAAGVFKMYGEHLALGQDLPAGLAELSATKDLEQRRRRFLLRELVLLQKISVSWEAPQMLRQAISIFGGHGIMEDFSALPRLLRDAFIMELWEGPRNVLLTQIHRDLARVKAWYPAEQLCHDLLAGAPEGVQDSLAGAFARLMAHPSLLSPDAATRRVCREWDALSLELCRAYQEQALIELGCDEEVAPVAHQRKTASPGDPCDAV